MPLTPSLLPYFALHALLVLICFYITKTESFNRKTRMFFAVLFVIITPFSTIIIKRAGLPTIRTADQGTE